MSHIGATILHPNTKVLEFQGLFWFLEQNLRNYFVTTLPRTFGGLNPRLIKFIDKLLLA
jgi:hypothetical protein